MGLDRIEWQLELWLHPTNFFRAAFDFGDDFRCDFGFEAIGLLKFSGSSSGEIDTVRYSGCSESAFSL